MRTCTVCGRDFTRKHGHICNTCTSARYRARHGRKQKPAERKACGWCGIVHPLRENGTTLDAEGLTHSQWVRFYGKPSRSTDLACIPQAPTPHVPRLPRAVKRELRTWVIIVQGSCAWCGSTFAALSTTGDARFCSTRCGKKSSKHKHGRFLVADRRRARLYERDLWTCQICHELTSTAYDVNDPWSPTLDHIEPQSSALLADHSDSNLRTVHALCNSLRGDVPRTDDEVRAMLNARPLVR